MVFSKSQVALVALSVLASSQQAYGRMRWMERDDRPVLLNPRRFGQEHPAVIDKIGQACPGQVCGVLSGAAITPLLAAQPECSQQDMADQIIDAAQQFDAATKANMIALAVEYRQAEKNTPPDFSTNPPTNRNSVFCQKAPKNAELNGLVQAQDPANDPNIFFDPALQKSVTKGSQANTSPFGGAASSGNNAVVEPSATAAASSSATADASAAPCETVVTVTVTASATAAASESATAVAASSAAAASSTAAAGAIGNFGSCSIPQIEFGVGFDNRKETSFQPVDKTSFNHGSAQNIDIITQFICDTLTNSCGADATAKATCATAKAAADTAAPKTGAQADLFNAAFGITTQFGQVTAVDDQGNAIAGSTTGGNAASSGSSSAVSSAVAASSTTAAAATSAAATSTSAAAAATTSAAAASGANLQKFTGALGGVTPPPVTALANGQFQVTGNAAFKDLTNALVRSCDVQHNQCANAANASGNKGALTVSACGDQQTQCNAAAQ